MIYLVGLGNTGVNIIRKLSSYTQYRTIEIDVGEGLQECKTPEEYEEKCPSFKKKFKEIQNKKVYLFLSAAGKVSGITLRVLEQLKGNELYVVCVHGDPITLSRMGTLQQNVVSNVLQEYARSGLLKKIYLIDNCKVEEMIEDVSLEDYWDKINELIAYVFHTNLYFQNTKPVIQSEIEQSDICRISTFGILTEQKEKRMLYSLRNILEEKYFFVYNKQDKKQSKNLLKDIKNFISDTKDESKKSFCIFENTNNDLNTYMESSTHILQNI